ncbi:Ig-like domain-containing protein, partial [Sulfitobacter noctilucicola]|uniref:Ig-like domain-containing protein n=1 Tax=Sulfitobacter noctilucicola TaxID=1342301 RepID=UPI0004691B1E
MIRTIDFNAFVAGTVIDDEYVVSDGVTVSAVARGDGADQAMIFDSNNPTGDDTDLASDTLDGLLIISEDGDSSDPDDNDAGGSIFFDFEDLVRIKSLTFKDIEETSGEGTRMIFYNADGEVIENQFVAPTGDGGETTVQLFVPGTARMEVRFEGSGAIDNLVFDDGKGADEAPTAVDDSAITDEDTSVIIDLRGNDNDPNNTLEELTIGEFVSPNGTVEDNGDGTVTFTPDQDFNGEAVFTYTLRDPNGNTDVGEVTVQVNPINDAPDAVADADTTDFNTAITVDLLANDTDPDIATNGDVLTVVAVSVPEAQGTVVNNGDGTATFTPADGYTGVATIAYTIEDEAGLRDSDEHFVTVEVDDNQPPVTGDDTLTTDEDTPSEPLNVLANDSDPDGDTLTLVSAESPDGEVSIDPDGEIVFTPTEDFNGETTITYTVTDPSGAESTGTVNVTVNPINDAPDAVDDSDTTEFETAVTVDLLANDTDVDIATNGDVITVIEATVPAEQGILVDNGDGTVTFTPADGFSGDATISYTIEDAAGLQDSALHTVTVGESTDVSPVAVDDVAETQEDTAVVIDLLGNDTDPDTPAEDLTISALSVPADQGEVVDNGDGTVTFTPAPDFNGEVTISYTVSDPEGNTDDGEAVVTVTPVADAPVTEPDALTTDEDTPSEPLNVLANDSDPDGDELTLISATSPDGEVSFDPNGEIVFTPNENFNGTTTIEYFVTDPSGLESPGIVNVTVNPVNDAPDAVDDTDVTDEDTSVEINLLANDTDVESDPLTVTTASVPAEEGTLEPVTDGSDGLYIFTPAPDFNGDATVSYSISDGNGGEDSAVHVITVGEENDAPVANPDTLTTDEDTPSEPLNVLANDSDPDGDPLTLTSATSPDGEVSFDPDGEIVFTPDENFNGETTITYIVTDPSGTESTGTVTVTVNPVNDAPDAVDDTDVTDEDTSVEINLLANDTDVEGDPLTVTTASVPAEEGTLEPVTDGSDGLYTFTPAPDFNGDATVSYTISDGNGGEDSAVHVITVGEENDAPVANPDTLTTDEDTPSEPLNVLANDTDPDGDPLELIEATSPDGTVAFTPEGEVIFTPDPDFNGETTITYTVTDPSGEETEGTVTVTVTPVNDAPDAVDDVDVTPEDTPITVDLLANDTDVDGDDLTVVEATVPEEQGTLVDNGDGTVTFTPAEDFTGEATISY